MFDAVAIVVPICVCVILPVAIVWIVFRTFNLKINRQSEVLIEAIKMNPNVDTEKLLDSLRKRDITPWMSLSRKLLRGCIFTLIGIAFAFFGAFLPDMDEAFGCWVVCGICGSIGIGFLISYWFVYKNIDKFNREREL